MTRVHESHVTSEEEYRSIFEAASDGLIIYDIGLDRVVEANPAAYQMHGYSREEFIGLNPKVLMPPESIASFRRHLRRTKSGGESQTQAVHLRRDGSSFHVEVHRSQISYGGRPCMLSVIRDVEQRIQTERFLQERLQSLAIREERQRLARNLHDAVNQLLFSAGLIADVLPRLWERDQEEACRSLDDLRNLTRGAVAEIRKLLVELHPSSLTDVGLDNLVHLLGNAFTARTNIPTKVVAAGEGSLPAKVQEAIYGICLEALNNIPKHAGTSRVEICLEHQEAGVELRICDDGLASDMEQNLSDANNLRLICEKAEAISAILDYTSQPEHGTKLTVRWCKTSIKEAL